MRLQTLSMVLAAGAGCRPLQDIEVTPGEIGTAVRVSWESPSAGEGGVTYRGLAGWHTAPAARAAVDGGYRYEAVLIGLTSQMETTGEVWVRDEDGEASVEEVAIQAGALGIALPSIYLTAADGEAETAGYVLTSLLRRPNAAVILGPGGEHVWAAEEPVGEMVMTEVHPTPDGQAVLMGQMHSGDAELSEIVEVSLDGARRRRLPAPGLHHSFTVLEDGTIAYIAYDWRDGQAGDCIVELHPDGGRTVVWSAWDHLDPGLAIANNGGSGWTHANALQHDPDEDAWYLSIHNYNSILKIDRPSGAVRWGLGGALDTLGLSDLLDRQHHFHRSGDELLVFNNRSFSSVFVEEVDPSEVISIRLDEAAGTASVLWRYTPSPAVYNLMLGDVQRLSPDRILATYSSSGVIEEFTSEGQSIRRLDLELGAALGFSQHFPAPEALGPVP